jgi:hypothetical protein
VVLSKEWADSVGAGWSGRVEFVWILTDRGGRLKLKSAPRQTKPIRLLEFFLGLDFSGGDELPQPEAMLRHLREALKPGCRMVRRGHLIQV